MNVLKYKVYYHKGCPDGQAATLAVQMYLQYKMKVWDVPELVPCDYQTVIPRPQKDEYCYMVDFCLETEAEVAEFQEKAAFFQIVDHHPRASKLAHLPAVIYDEKESGATLTWKTLMPTEHMPLLFQYARDRDLWLWELPQSKEISAAIYSYQFSLAQYGRLMDDMESSAGFAALLKEGKALIRMKEKEVAGALAGTHFVKLRDSWWPCVNTAANQSEVCHALIEKYPNIGNSCIYYRSQKGWEFSLRAY